MIPNDMARCLGHGAGPSGHQNRMDCQNCARRLAPRGGYVSFMAAPKEFPCPERIAAEQTEEERQQLMESARSVMKEHRAVLEALKNR